ncbi:TRF-like 6 [Hibiscus trionum]|uniref:TRF-like 6 n=1 Tax=Hibiscus trionum TaxID=183268 RepID=A0A9W7IFK2_HIBTR|nr:TRF-like 6 [Hibiscus trionum]
MEKVVEVEGSGEGKFEATGLEKNNFILSSPRHVADPVVYKLVRVDGNGQLVPATDDELMVVEGLLENEKYETHIVADTGQALGCISNEVSSSGMPQLESSEGLSQSENTEADTEKLSSQLEETVPCGAQSLSDDHAPGSVGECLKPLDGPIHGGSSTSAGCISSKPDFSKLKGEICLDNLSIKELHEVFKATFGRDTTVKDKLWLKRRIAMGLTNSCDVSTTTFVIKDNKLLKKDNEDGANNVNLATVKEFPAVAVEYSGDMLNSLSSQIDENQTVSAVRSGNNVVENNFANEDLAADQRAAKRVRKPTKRYIEELSETESKEYNGNSGRLLASTKNIELRPLPSKSHARLARNASLEGRTVITRLDSLGGFGIQVPCVYRVRRSRPRKNVTALLKFHPSGMSMTSTFIKRGLDVHGSEMSNESMDKVLVAKSSPEQAPHQFALESNKEKSSTDWGQNMELKYVDPSGDTSDDNVVTVPTAKGGIRRKHHRAWTLSEVMKLVEGVSKYGAGRWSEIKRLAFASYSYRTSVDLKDKWRNLLKASFAQTPVNQGAVSRKHPSMPIPAPILLRVRELAEMQAQGPSPNLSSSKLLACGGGGGGGSVNETRPGYL